MAFGQKLSALDAASSDLPHSQVVLEGHGRCALPDSGNGSSQPSRGQSQAPFLPETSRWKMLVSESLQPGENVPSRFYKVSHCEKSESAVLVGGGRGRGMEMTLLLP